MIGKQNLKKANKVVATTNEEKGRDWTQLHPELLHLISKKMENMSNMIRFRAVCKEWRLAADPTDSLPQLPWLILPGHTSTKNLYNKEGEYLVYSPSSNTTHQVYLPMSEDCFIQGSSAGFLFVYYDDICSFTHSPFLLNPLTGTTLDLPFPSLACYSIVYLGHDPTHNSLSLVVVERSNILMKTLIEYVVFLQHDIVKHITFAIPMHFKSIGYYKERLFVSLCDPKMTWVYDVTTGNKTSIEIPHPGEDVSISYLIEATGDLLGVARYYCTDGTGYQFKVYKLVHTDGFGCCHWTQLKGIGNRILFLQTGHFSYGKYTYGFCLRASDMKWFKGNCIIYLTEWINNDLFYQGGCVCRYDMESGTTQELVDSYMYSTWFLPTLGNH